ncbi:hypothetical protein NIES4103_64560 [Nostoc sp. NIES-4103]|nr:hypothetical protein NIES4103_64560 [Nostoc sp. NIES-4103]
MLLSGSKTNKSLLYSSVYLSGLACSLFSIASISIAATTSVEEKQMLKQDTATGENSNVIQQENISFNLQKCQRNAQSKIVSCQLLITATSEMNQRIQLYGNRETASPRVFDLSGNEYTANFVQLGKYKSTSDSNGSVVNELIPGIATKLIVNFDLPQDLTQLAALEIKYDSYKQAAFRDIKITTVANAVRPNNRKK